VVVLTAASAMQVVFKSCLGIIGFMVLLVHVATYAAELRTGGALGDGAMPCVDGAGAIALSSAHQILRPQLKVLDAQVGAGFCRVCPRSSGTDPLEHRQRESP
jgi:hypothetical protein